MNYIVVSLVFVTLFLIGPGCNVSAPVMKNDNPIPASSQCADSAECETSAESKETPSIPEKTISDLGSQSSEQSSFAKLTSENCIDPEISKVSAATSLTLCNGTEVSGQLANCAQEGDSDCYLPEYAAGTQPLKSINSDNISATLGAFSVTDVSEALLRPTLSWENSSGATDYKVAVIPFANSCPSSPQGSSTNGALSFTIAEDLTVATSYRACVYAIAAGTYRSASNNGQTFQTIDLSDELYSFWAFDDGNGTSALDSTGNGHAATLVNYSGSTEWQTGISGGALAFNGTNQYVDTGISLQGVDDYTISLWFKTSNATACQMLTWQGYATGNGFGDGSAANSTKVESHLTVNHSGVAGYMSAFHGWNETIPSSLRFNATFPIDTSWHHVAWIVSNATTLLHSKLYVDGALVADEKASQVDQTYLVGNMLLGRPGASTRYFVGLLDQVRIYHRVLSQSEISALYTTQQ